jgi:hypothetical protein
LRSYTSVVSGMWREKCVTKHNELNILCKTQKTSENLSILNICISALSAKVSNGRRCRIWISRKANFTHQMMVGISHGELYRGVGGITGVGGIWRCRRV